MARDSSSEAKMKELVFFSAYLTTLFQMVLNYRRFNDLQILQVIAQAALIGWLTR
jgi:hypothetical protein